MNPSLTRPRREFYSRELVNASYGWSLRHAALTQFGYVCVVEKAYGKLNLIA
jgi:hypothetical protein